MTSRFHHKIYLYVSTILTLFFINPKIIAAPDWLKEVIESSKNQDIDENADAILLYIEKKVEIFSDGRAKHHIKKAVQIQKSTGVEYASLLEYSSPYREVKNINGWKFELNGKESKLKKENVVSLGIQESQGYYDDQFTVVAAFQEASSGDIIGYEYEIEEKKGIDGLYQTFIFQNLIPVQYAKFEVIVPEGWELYSSEQHIDPINFEHTKNIYSWTTTGLSNRPKEPLMPPLAEIQRNIKICTYNPNDSNSTHFINWNTVSDWGWKLYNGLSQPDDLISNTATEITKNCKTNTEKLVKISRYIQEKIRYVAVEIGQGRFLPRNANSTFSNKYGDCKDKVTLMISMLNSIGVESHPVLAQTEYWVDKNFPNPFQFNHVIITIPITYFDSSYQHLPAVKDGYLYFDPTDPATPIGYLPTVLYGSNVLRISKNDDSLVSLPELIPDNYFRSYYAEVTLLKDNTINGEIRIVDYYDRSFDIAYYRNQNPIKEVIDNYQSLLSNSINNLIISDFEFSNNADSAWLTFKIEGDNYMTESGELKIGKIDFFHPDKKNLLRKKSSRISPVSFDNRGIIETNFEWSFPSEWEIEMTIKPIEAKCSIASIKSETVVSSHQISFYSRSEYRKGSIPPEDYLKAYNFEKKKNSINSLKFIIK